MSAISWLRIAERSSRDRTIILAGVSCAIGGQQGRKRPPNLIAWEADEVAPLLIIEDLAAHPLPPPWDMQRVEGVVAQIHAMYQTPAQFAPLQTILLGRHVGWAAVVADKNPKGCLFFGTIRPFVASIVYRGKKAPPPRTGEAGRR